MCMNGQPCSSPLCKYRVVGAGISTPKLHPATVGRTPREKLYARQHPTCEAKGCRDAARHVHHVLRRGMGGTSSRDTSPLLALCEAHHAAIHAGQLDDGRKAKATTVGPRGSDQKPKGSAALASDLEERRK